MTDIIFSPRYFRKTSVGDFVWYVPKEQEGRFDLLSKGAFFLYYILITIGAVLEQTSDKYPGALALATALGYVISVGLLRLLGKHRRLAVEDVEKPIRHKDLFAIDALLFMVLILFMIGYTRQFIA